MTVKRQLINLSHRFTRRSSYHIRSSLNSSTANLRSCVLSPLPRDIIIKLFSPKLPPFTTVANNIQGQQLNLTLNISEMYRLRQRYSNQKYFDSKRERNNLRWRCKYRPLYSTLIIFFYVFKSNSYFLYFLIEYLIEIF